MGFQFVLRNVAFESVNLNAEDRIASLFKGESRKKTVHILRWIKSQCHELDLPTLSSKL